MSTDTVIPYRHGEIPSTYSNVYRQNNRGIIQKSPREFDTPLFSLFLFLYFPHQWHQMPSRPRKKQKKSPKKRNKQGHTCWSCAYNNCVERWAELLKDAHTFLAWRRHKRSIVDLSLCVSVSAHVSRVLEVLCLNYVCEKNECLETSRLTLYHLCHIWVGFVVLF